ncbi:hypothetical protein E2C01_056808 [Portunus trituberculatus]|uniref:Uncharacterized protein n=1 Tax=Portunus trituberculatus TaxID=210409 RepID=A0A5B7H0K9_PORTR|nr:hypothetical protein [Portunus trituberculatus]
MQSSAKGKLWLPAVNIDVVIVVVQVRVSLGLAGEEAKSPRVVSSPSPLLSSPFVYIAAVLLCSSFISSRSFISATSFLAAFSSSCLCCHTYARAAPYHLSSVMSHFAAAVPPPPPSPPPPSVRPVPEPLKSDPRGTPWDVPPSTTLAPRLPV